MVKDSAFILCLLEGFAGNSKRVNILLTINKPDNDIISCKCFVMNIKLTNKGNEAWYEKVMATH